jgi:hypothetical protein
VTETVAGNALEIVIEIEAEADTMVVEAMIGAEAAVVGLATGTAAGAGVKIVIAGRCAAIHRIREDVVEGMSGAAVGTGLSNTSRRRKMCSGTVRGASTVRQP